MSQFTSISGGKGRFDSCQTVDDVKSKMRKNETLGLFTYGGGSQYEVRTVRFGRVVLVACFRI